MKCKSCGHSFKGTYCNQCGEKVIDQKDRQLRHFFGEVVAAFTFADTKFWRSVKLLITSPGRLSSDYAQGIRQRYMKPVSLFFLANFVYFLYPTFDVFTTRLYSQSHYFYYSDEVTRLVEERVEQKAISYEAYETEYNQKTAELSKLLLMLMVLIISISVWILHIRSKRLFADHLLISLEFFSFMLIYSIIGFGTLMLIAVKTGEYFGHDLKFLFDEEVILVLPVVISTFVYFFFRAERTFYQASIGWAIARSILLIAAFYYSLMIYRWFLFYITYWSV